MSDVHTFDPTDEKTVQADNAAFVTRMQKIASGDIEAPSEVVTYLLDQYKATEASLAQAQQALTASQEAIIKARGRLDGLEKDLRHWDAQNPADKPAEG